MATTAIVFYSRDGSTRTAAGVLSDRLGAATVELADAGRNPGFLLSGFRAKTGRRVRLAGDPWSEAKAYDRLVLAAPIWAGSGNPAMNAFLDGADLTGKTVYLLTVQADPGHGQADTVLDHYARRVRESGGAVGGALAITGSSPGKTASEEDVRAALGGWEIE